MNKFMSF